ncbi:MAG: LysM peptidoglycan-binding domain-containing protein, partial [Lutimonas sp.]
ALEIPEESRVVVVEKEEKKSGRIAYRSSSVDTYTVDKGDTLYSIARDHELSVEELKELNKLNSNHLSIGQELIVSE